ncbi:MAG TPA: dihydroneopterin aldolase [Flavobacteriales bacterium]|jgi:dihydroneopterin aldolase|nr:dihydroneopterin aldolase [Flavobacteriales bacterium]
MGLLVVEGIRTYSYHGCIPLERKVGGEFKTSVKIDYDFSILSGSDDLNKTIDYAKVIEVVEREMAKPANLIETAARNIIRSIQGSFKGIAHVEVKIEKPHAPINQHFETLAVVLTDRDL